MRLMTARWRGRGRWAKAEEEEEEAMIDGVELGRERRLFGAKEKPRCVDDDGARKMVD